MRRSWGRVALAMGVTASLLAACGTDDGTAEEVPSTDPVVDPTSPDESDEVESTDTTSTTVEEASAPSTTSATTNTAAAPPGSDPQRYEVIVDNGANVMFPASYNEFYPASLTVRPGDEISFVMPTYQGEPHNVAVGRVIDGAVDAYRALPPDTLVFPGGPLPGVTPEQAAAAAKLPPSLPPNMEPSDQAFAKLAPCWLDDEDPPLGEPCPPEARDVEQIFTGTENYVASPVLIDDGDEFVVRLADDIEPGEYGFMCTMHPSSMFGSFEVAAADASVPSPDEVGAEGEAELAALNGELRPAAEELAGQSALEVQAGDVTGGLVPPYSINVFPSLIEAAAGDTVTWEIHGAHMLTFNPPPDEPLFVTLERDGDIVRPTAANYEQPGPGQEGMPGGLPMGPVEIDGGVFAGEEFLHSGLLYGRIGPLPPAKYSLTFTEPGSYTYYCLRHPGMVGIVEVEP